MNTTIRISTAERLGRAFGRGCRAYARGERSVREIGREDILQGFATDLEMLWGDPTRSREVRWPINIRLGML